MMNNWDNLLIKILLINKYVNNKRKKSVKCINCNKT